MKRCVLVILLASVVLNARPVRAQEVTLPDYTPEQRWNRLALLMADSHAALIALGKEHGMTAEATGVWLGKFFSQTWLSGAEADQYLVGLHRNFMAMPGATVEVMASTPTSVTARFNQPENARLGAGGRSIGIPGRDIQTMLRAMDATIAEWAGVAVEHRADGDHDVLTFTTKYGPIEASDDIRWARRSYLSWLNSLQLMSLQKKSGLSAREIGEASAKLHGPTWTARTPWQLFRGMVWNWMSDMNAECEVLSASASEVRGRCRVHYQQLVLNQQDRFGVTPEDVLESGRAFAMGVADQLGMRWEESLVDGYRVIRVTKK